MRGDVSYFEKYAANAAFRKLHDGGKMEDDPSFDPMTVEDFNYAFSSYFTFRLKEIVGQHYPLCGESSFVFCLDCARNDIWRKSVYQSYKYNRDNIKKKFSWYSIEYWTERWIKDHVENRGSKMIKIPGAEADDIIAVVAGVVEEELPDVGIVIVSGDSDLLQLGSHSVIQIDAKGEEVTVEKKLAVDKVHFEPTPANYLIYKILTGDATDAIPSVKHGKCGPKTAAGMISSGADVKAYIRSDPQISEAFVRNATLINLKQIPQVLKESIIAQYREN